MAYHFIKDIGGKDNIATIDNCTTRLRLTINDMDIVQDSALKAHGAKGIMKLNKNNLQVVVGTEVEFVADAMKRLDMTSFQAGTLVVRQITLKQISICR